MENICPGRRTPPPGPPLTHRKHRFPSKQNYTLAAFEA